MADQQTSPKTNDVAALIAATDRNGQVDPIAYEA